MFVTEKYHLKRLLSVYIEENDKLKKEIRELQKELEEARNLKELLGKFTDAMFSNGNVIYGHGSGFSYSLPDSVLQYTEDILGGKVIKQEGNKCLIIDKEGNVKTGLTKQKVDKGYKYKLIRE